MIGLFCRTRGWSNDLFAAVVSVFRAPYCLPPAKGLLGEMNSEQLEKITANIRTNGYHVFDTRLPEHLCDRLLTLALSRKCTVRAMDEGGGSAFEVPHYDRSRPVGVRYDLFPDDVISDDIVQKLMADLSLIAVAQSYLKARPIVDVTALWWNTDFSERADCEAAQLFHFDMDRIKWLKFFICITDVDHKSGPHSFVAGSHRTGAIPPELLTAGYARLTDNEVKKHFDEKRLVEFCATRGTILAEDTRGLHKGKRVELGDRLMFQIQFSNSLFGATIRGGRIKEILDPDLRALVEKYPRMYSNFMHA